MIERWGAFLARRAGLVLVAGLVLTALAGVVGAGVFASLSNGGFDDPDSESARERVLEREAFGNLAVDVVAVFSSDELAATDDAFRAEVGRVLDRVPEEHVTSVVSFYDTEDPSMLGTDGRAVQVAISLAGETQDETSDHYEAVEPLLESGLLRVDLAGPWATYTDLNHMAAEDLERAELIALPIVLVLSLIIFRSVVAALMPVMVGVVAMVGALALVRGIAEVAEVSVFAVNIITLLGMGLAIDYALFVVSRFREELARLPVDDPTASHRALVVTMSTAGRTILFSGLTVAAAMASLLVFPQAFLKSIGYGGIAAVLVAMVASLTILPAVLRLLGRRVDAGRIRLRRSAATAPDAPTDVLHDDGAWARLARSVMRRPVVYLVVITAALLALGSPFLGAKWGSVDYRVLPPDAASHVAAERLNTDFGAERSSANVLLTGADQADVTAYAAELGGVDGVLDVAPIAESGDGTVLLRAVWAGNSQTEGSQELVRALRAVPAPAGSEALVGGLTADTVDLIGSIGDHLPWMALLVVVVMLVLLFLAFGSLVLPVKAVLMNALSITASFGIVTWIFSDGHLEGLLGYTSSGFLDATQPILMLAILFGLSMDYEVFLLSRVREQWDRTGDNELSVATGVQKTGRIITSAALLLGVVIGAFGLSGIVFMKMIGIGMLVALLIDATVIRALLVPATMKLLGDWNWWAPGPMRRWWERYGFREEPRSIAAEDASDEPVLVGR
ncbi:MMPL family transporter [Nocardioides sp.]|uniref:MMPL family transporter n=1 Tax=Nocardioides sp. TaxID=35761 RepID=UPI0027330152|nr:MMPL family transporter [Nocardioides sp.]MDP3894452.1 MMPL family transporter [Nocardioides sp.]